jgi:polyhydroxybutyrate depolymerase
MKSRLVLAVAMAACGNPPAARPTTFGGDRPVDLQIPTNLDDGKLYPLVLILHGYGASGFVQEAFFQFKPIVTGGEAFVLAPDGLVDSTGHQYWNADPACCDFDHANPDDSGYLGGVLQAVIAAWPIDPASVVLLGHSNGGYMAYRMACDHADIVTNALVLAGGAASDPSVCQPAHAVNVLHIHGTADDEVPYTPTAAASVAQWQTHDGCGSTMTPGPALDLDTGLPGAETSTATSDGCPPGVAVDLWTITGGTHIPSFGADIGATLFGYAAAHRRD